MGRILNELAGLVGVAPDRLVPIVGAENTRDEARRMRDVAGTNVFYLVTSDLHMPRAMMIFKQEGMQPLAAPAGPCARVRPGRWGTPAPREHLPQERKSLRHGPGAPRTSGNDLGEVDRAEARLMAKQVVGRETTIRAEALRRELCRELCRRKYDIQS